MDGWREAADLRDLRVDDALVTAAEQAIGPDDRVSGDPEVLAVLSPTYVEIGLERLKFPVALLLTSSCIVFAKRKGFGRGASVTTLFRYDVAQHSDPQSLPERHYVVLDHDRFGVIRIYFQTRRPAQYVADYLASG